MPSEPGCKGRCRKKEARQWANNPAHHFAQLLRNKEGSPDRHVDLRQDLLRRHLGRVVQVDFTNRAGDGLAVLLDTREEALYVVSLNSGPEILPL